MSGAGLREGLLYFEGLEYPVERVGRAEADECPSPREIRCAVVTELCGDDSTDDYPVADWWPRFWGERRLVTEALVLVSSAVADPVVWSVGEYMSTEVEALVRAGLLPGTVASQIPRFDPRHPKLKVTYHVLLILRHNCPAEVVLPFHQGFGHFPGVRLLVFSGRNEPVELYEEWLTSAARGVFALDPSLASEKAIPASAAGLLAPVGDEDRDHAAIGCVGWEPDQLARALADAVALPLLRTRVGDVGFEAWEAEYTLPADVVVEPEE